MTVIYRALEDEFGDVVGKARRGQELSIDDLAERTKIEARVLEAIEAYEGPTDEGVVRGLAEALGLHEGKLQVSAEAAFFPAVPHPEGERTDELEVRMLVLGTDFLMNGYVAICPHTRRAAVIDPGFQAERILQAVRAADAQVTEIWLTHGHHDHVDALVGVATATGVDAAICATDLELTGDRARHIGQRLIPGEQVRVGEQTFDIRATGGHTPGGISLLHSAGIAFVGDALFAGSLGGTRNRTAYAGQQEAVAAQLLSLAPETTLYPGHGPATTVAEELAHNPFFG
jgi:glyoxylase-like metal-dependent hydrolase (beta-lactamase superfamily II)